MEALKALWTNYLIHVTDILLVAFLFYQMMILVKGTRAVQIIVGILTLLIGTFLAREVLHLSTLSWLLEKFWLAGVIILAVVFQPEIRSALAQLGSHKWGRILVDSELEFINEILGALKELRERHLGALIAIEHDTGLRNYIETGVLINARISRELMLAIFNPKSPMHDGAIIVQNTRLIAAGCVLPLSHEPVLSKVLGTRHRAAIGLSEVSDAVVIVLSEETGKVSVATDGILESNIESEELRKRLIDIYRERRESLPTLRRHK